MRVLIVGCGYVGLPLAARLVGLGHDVWGLRRSCDDDAALAASGIHPLTADITRPETLPGGGPGWDWVVLATSSKGAGPEAYQTLYLGGTANVIRWLAATPPRRWLYLSSTSVYGQADGSEVTESSPADPANASSQLLLQAEQLVRDAGRGGDGGSVILRAAGIYGPGRGHLFLQYLRGEATLTGAGDRWLNMVHRDDLVGACVAALERGVPGATYNVADSGPVQERDFFQWLSDTLRRPMPPAVDPGQKARKRGATSKRISNRKLVEELGYRLLYPTYREGYTAEINRLQLNT